MDAKKVLKTTGGVALYSAGVVAELAKYGLHIADVFVCGAKALADHFVKGPDLKIGETLMSDVQKGVGQTAAWLKKKGKGLMH